MGDTPEILWPALRQYRHNTEPNGFPASPQNGYVAAFASDETVEIVTTMEEKIKELEAQLAAKSEYIDDLNEQIQDFIDRG